MRLCITPSWQAIHTLSLKLSHARAHAHTHTQMQGADIQHCRNTALYMAGVWCSLIVVVLPSG